MFVSLLVYHARIPREYLLPIFLAQSKNTNNKGASAKTWRKMEKHGTTMQNPIIPQKDNY